MILVLFSVIAIFISFLLWKDSQRPPNFPPGPKWWPIVGNIPLVAKMLSSTGYHHKVWDNLVKDYGPIVGLKLGRHKVVIVSGKNLIKEVSLRDDLDGRPDGFMWRTRARGGRLGVVFIDGPIWAEHRRFSIQHLKKLGYGKGIMEDLIIEEVTDFVKWLKSLSGKPINMEQVFDVPVLNILWAMIAGKRYERDDEKLKNVCKSVHNSFRLIDASGGILQQLPILHLLAPFASGYDSLSDDLNKAYSFLIETLEEHKATIKPDIDRDFIDTFLHKMEENQNENSTFNENQLLVLCLDLLQAGSDTTSNTIGFIMVYMAKYQIIQKKVQKEIDEIIGRDRKPCLADKYKMPYTSAVILEVQRVASIAPMGVPHRATSSTHLAGYTIPKDTTILMSMHSIYRDENWNDDFLFSPERFLDEYGNVKKQCDDQLGTFGYGRRKCIGENLAKANIFLFSVILFQNFDLMINPLKISEFSTEPINGITLSPKAFEAIWTIRK